MEASVSRALPQDIPVLNVISFTAKAHWGYPADWLEHWKPDLLIGESDFASQQILKLSLGEEIIGFCSIQESQSAYEITHLWILPRYIGQGFGTLLLRGALTEVVKILKPITVEADPNAEGFYVRQGFKTVGKVESYPPGRFFPVMQRAH